MSCPLADLPVEVLLDHLLPELTISGLLSLTCTSRFFADLGEDDTLWKRKLYDDFNFTGEGTARMSGWKFIYRGLAHPKAFVWGQNTRGRLGLSGDELDKFSASGVPFPNQIHIPGKRIVSLVPGGWSFHALDSKGDVFVWGTLDASTLNLNSDGFSEPSKEASTPHRLRLPSPIRSISAGRAHALMLATTGVVYTFHSWGRPYSLRSRLLSARTGEDAVKQVEAGWGFCAALTHAGHVLVWWPGSDPLQAAYDTAQEGLDERVRQGEDKLKVRALEGTKDIPCHVFELEVDPVQLDDVPPNLPDLPLEEGAKRDAATRIVKIAGADNVLIALTNGGHVLKYSNLIDEASHRQGRWEYLRNFSEAKAVSEHEAFQKVDGEEGYVHPPEFMRVTHISAHFNSFVAYSTGSSSIVLIGASDTVPDALPRVIPELQHQGVIAVVLGDYHFAALTSYGQLLTWGSYSAGALGLGDPAHLPVGAPGGYATESVRQRALEGHRAPEPPRVDVPTPVHFGRGEKFAFLAAAAGWHTGALVIDLDDADNAPAVQEYEELHVDMPGKYEPQYLSTPPADARPVEAPGTINPHPFPNRAPGQIPIIPILRGGARGFRVGLAGARGRAPRGPSLPGHDAEKND